MQKSLTSQQGSIILSAGRVSVSACGRYKKASITIEAAMAVPLFFLAVVSLLYLMEAMAVRTSVRAGLEAAGKKAMADTCLTPVIASSDIERNIVYAVGAERLERSIVAGGSSGLSCRRSYMSAVTGIGRLTVEYQIRLPVPVFNVSPVTYEESIRIKAWNGYEKGLWEQESSETVYITETGTVYHKDYHCTYLDLSIRMVQASEIKNLRNSSGGRYYSCKRCAHKASAGVYITDDGDRYHNSLSCSGLKRTVYAVPLSEALGKGACVRCTGS